MHAFEISVLRTGSAECGALIGVVANQNRNIATEVLASCDQYRLQFETFSRAVRGEIPLPYGFEDALMNMRIIDALFRSEKSGRFEDV